MIWLDLETTGLDPVNDKILELAMVNDETGEKFQAIVSHDGQGLSPFILDMHTKNGLLAECTSLGLRASQVEARAIEWLGEGTRLQLAGSSIHFDVSFLRVHMPILAAAFSHRLFDVSAIKLFCESIGMAPIPKANAHRALADIEESRAHLAMCAGWVTG
jgi:oligoribonuclease